MIKYANELKARYRLGKVQNVKKSADGHARSVKLVYKNPDEKSYREVDRPIHGIAVIVPIEEQSYDVASNLDPNATEFQPNNANTNSANIHIRSSCPGVFGH